MEIIFQRGSIRVEKTDHATTEVVDLVAGTTWGTPGKTQWKQMKTAYFLPRVIKPTWITLLHGQKTLSAVALLHRTVSSGSGPVNGYFLRYLAFPEERQTNKSAKKNPANGKNRSFGPLRQSLLDVFDAPQLLRQEVEQPEKAVFYAFVELDNERSISFCEAFGFEPIRNFSTLAFSRLFPRRCPGARKARPEEKQEILNRIRAQYREFCFFFPDHCFYLGDYYVLEEGGEIVAGVQAVAEHWQIRNLPGFSGKLTRKALPRIPLLSRLFNPDAFHLALFEGIFVSPGHEGSLFRLLESVLAEIGLHTAFIWTDMDCALSKMLRESGKLGLLHRLNGESPATVIARFHGFSPEEVQAFRKNPAYLSAFDMA